MRPVCEMAWEGREHALSFRACSISFDHALSRSSVVSRYVVQACSIPLSRSSMPYLVRACFEHALSRSSVDFLSFL
eukprot:67725-Amorphochlora_amoeboformis.AAC.1